MKTKEEQSQPQLGKSFQLTLKKSRELCLFGFRLQLDCCFSISR